MTLQLTIICGNAGVGKTTYAHRLGQEKGAAVLDIDTVSERLVRAGLSAMNHDPDDRDSSEYKRIYREAIHATLFAIARENLAYTPCIIVAPFTQERRDPNFPRTIFEETGAVAKILYLTCSELERKARITARKNPRDAAKLLGWEEYSRHGQDGQAPPFEHERIDTSQ